MAKPFLLCPQNTAAILGISFNRSRNDLLRLADSRLYFICSVSSGAASNPNACSMSSAISALKGRLAFSTSFN